MLPSVPCGPRSSSSSFATESLTEQTKCCNLDVDLQHNTGWSHKKEGTNRVQQEGNPLQLPIPSSLQSTDGSRDLLILIGLHGMQKECSS